MDAHAAKRQKTLTELPTPITPVSPTFDLKVSASPDPTEMPSQVVAVSNEGDAIIIVTGIAGTSNLVGLRVSTELLSITSPELKRLLAEANTGLIDEKPVKILTLTGDNGNAMVNMLNILHLRNDILPARVEPIDLSRLCEVSAKYQCLPAVSRATSPWFDHIFTRHPDPPLYLMTQSALVLGDAIYFARFSSRWVLHEALSQQLTPTIPMSPPHVMLSRALLRRQEDGLQSLRIDIEDLVHTLADVMFSEAAHYIDCPPGGDPAPVQVGGDPDAVHCAVDKEGAVEYLVALRNACIWPSTTWPNTNLKAVTDAVASFRIPDYDASEHCHYCMHIDDEFTAGVDEIQEAQRDRLWGLCLDCFKFSGVNPADCRYEHPKPAAATLALRVRGNASGRPR